MENEKPIMQRVLVTHQAFNPAQGTYDPLCPHSEYVRVTSATLLGTNILRMEHGNGEEVSMVVLGEGYTVSYSIYTDS